MKVSVIINNYNYINYLADAINSALAQKLRPYEIILVDDGSTDGSPDFAEANYGSRVNLIRSKNGGQLSAFCKGLEAASGDYVALLDSDDVWKPTHLELVANVIERDLSIDFLMTNLEYFGNLSGKWSKETNDYDYGITAALVSATGQWIGAPTSSLILRRVLLASILHRCQSLIDEWRIGADDCVVMGGSILGGHKYRIAEPTVFYRAHGSNGVLGVKSSPINQMRYLLKVDRLTNYLLSMNELTRNPSWTTIALELTTKPRLDATAKRAYLKLALKTYIWRPHGFLRLLRALLK